MYNATNHFIDRHAGKTSGSRIAYTDHAGDWTYQQLAILVDQAGNVLSNLGLKAEQRVLMCMTDSVSFPAVFWGAIKIGAIPVPVNTMLTDVDYAYMLHDSCARVVVVSESLYPKFTPHIDGQSSLEEVVIDGSSIDGRPSLSVLMESFEAELSTAPTPATPRARCRRSRGCCCAGRTTRAARRCTGWPPRARPPSRRCWPRWRTGLLTQGVPRVPQDPLVPL